MARYIGPVCKLCRAEGIKLFLKGKKCLSAKCPVSRRNYPPGQHGQRRGSKRSDYGLQLREKQKAKRSYGVLERQFRRYYQEATRMRGVTGENLLHLLERRLDNVIYRLGFASSRTQARQLIRHNHIVVDGIRVNIPSFLVKVGHKIEIKEVSRDMPAVLESLQLRKSTGSYPWLIRDDKAFSGEMTRLPSVDEIALPVKEQMIVELYSK
ncbi:MAG: 30S ribosomal protein S4 [Candidatus Hinthialibacter antarcticus]|nr:30S ribosomal protein S4 [Candidatus Hinthialibacter antarcticus]